MLYFELEKEREREREKKKRALDFNFIYFHKGIDLHNFKFGIEIEKIAITIDSYAF